MGQSYCFLIHRKFWHLKFLLYWEIPRDFSLEMLEVNLEPGTLWLSSDQSSENCWAVKPTRLPSAYQGPWKLAQVFDCGSRSSDNVPVIRASRLPSGDPGSWDLSWRRPSQASLLLTWRSRPVWVWNIVGSQATCAGLCVRCEAQEPLCPGLAALVFSGLKSQDDTTGSAISEHCIPVVCIPWRTVLLGSPLGKQLSKRSDSVKYFTERLGLDGLTHHDDVKFLFLLENSTWACPWGVRARVGAVNTLGPMADDDDGAVPAWLRWDKVPLAHIWACLPWGEAQWVVFQFLCISNPCRFAVISRGFEIGLSWLSWRRTVLTVKEWKCERSQFRCCPVCLTWWKPVVQSCANGSCIVPYLELCNSWQLT